MSLVVPLPVPDPPEPPAGLLKVTVGDWARFWTSPVAGAVDRSSDMPAVRRLFCLLDERERAYRGFRRRRLVAGSAGQPVASPLLKVMATLDSEIRALEDRFGLTPTARLRLGIQFGEAQQTLADLNASLDAGLKEADDPRLDGGASS